MCVLMNLKVFSNYTWSPEIHTIKEVRFIWDKVIRFEKYFLQVLFSQY